VRLVWCLWGWGGCVRSKNEEKKSFFFLIYIFHFTFGVTDLTLCRFRFLWCFSDQTILSCSIPSSVSGYILGEHSARSNLLKEAVEVLSRRMYVPPKGYLDLHPRGARHVVLFRLSWRKIFLFVQPKPLLPSARCSSCSLARSGSSCNWRAGLLPIVRCSYRSLYAGLLRCPLLRWTGPMPK